MPKYKLYADAGRKADRIAADNGESAGQRGSGREEVLLEGRGPGGAAVIARCLTDDRSRTAAAIGAIFEQYGGSLGESGSVKDLFEEKGLLVIDREYNDEDEDAIVMTALESGAEDVVVSDECYEVVTEPRHFDKVKRTLLQEGYGFAGAAIRLLPRETAPVERQYAGKLLRMMNAIERHDDVLDLYANVEIGEEDCD